MNTFQLACRASIGFLLLSVFVFTQRLYHIEYGPLAIIMFLCSITFASDQLEYGFVSLGCLQSTASLIFGATFGYLGAWLSGNSSLLTLLNAGIGTALFTALHPYQKTSFITSNGEIYFIFNLLDSKKPGSDTILWDTFYETMIGALLAHITALFVSSIIFPKSTCQEMYHYLSCSLEEAGIVASKTASLLFNDDPLWEDDTMNNRVMEVIQEQNIQQHWEWCKWYLQRANNMSTCVAFEWNSYMDHQGSIKLVIKEIETLIDRLQALQILLAQGQRRCRKPILDEWEPFTTLLRQYFAWIAAKCHDFHKVFERIKVQKRPEVASFWQSEAELSLNRFNEEFRRAYERYFGIQAKSSKFSVFDHGPWMFLVVLSKSILNSLEDMDHHMMNLILERQHSNRWLSCKYFIVEHCNVLLWPFHGWLNLFQCRPREWKDCKLLFHSTKVQFFFKKWLVSLGILTLLLASPFYEQFANFNGAWLWLSYILYMQPSTEGTLMNGIANIFGVFFACIFSALLMFRPITATNGYLLDAYLVMVTFISVFLVISPVSETCITFAFTSYVLILYYFNPYEFHEGWRYSITRFMQIFLGIVVAVLMNILVMPFSAFEEATTFLKQLLEKMVSLHAIFLFPKEHTLSNNNTGINDYTLLSEVWKDFSYISSTLSSVCNGIFEATGLSVVSNEVTIALHLEEELLYRLKALYIVSDYSPIITGSFHPHFREAMTQLVGQDWDTLLFKSRQLMATVQYLLNLGENFQSGLFLKDILQQMRERIGTVTQDAASEIVKKTINSLLMGSEKLIDLWSDSCASSSVAPIEETKETENFKDKTNLLGTIEWLKAFYCFLPASQDSKEKVENDSSITKTDSSSSDIEWMSPALASAYRQALEDIDIREEWSDYNQWLSLKKSIQSYSKFHSSFNSLQEWKRKLSHFRYSSGGLYQRIQKPVGIGETCNLSQRHCMNYQTFPFIPIDLTEQIENTIREMRQAQGIFYLHMLSLEYRLLRGLPPFEVDDTQKKETFAFYFADDYVYHLACMFASAYFLQGRPKMTPYNHNIPNTFTRLLKHPEQSLRVQAAKVTISGKVEEKLVNLFEVWRSCCSVNSQEKGPSFQDFRKIDPHRPTLPFLTVWGKTLFIAIGDSRAILFRDSMLLLQAPSSSRKLLLSQVTDLLTNVRGFSSNLCPCIGFLEGLVSGSTLLLEKELAQLEPRLLKSLQALQAAYDYDQLEMLRYCSTCLESLMKQCEAFYHALDEILQSKDLCNWIILEPSSIHETASYGLTEIEAMFEPCLQHIVTLQTRCKHLLRASVDVDQALRLSFDLVRNKFLGFDLLGTLFSCVLSFVSIFIGFLGFNVTIPIYSSDKGSQYYWYGAVSNTMERKTINATLSERMNVVIIRPDSQVSEVSVSKEELCKLLCSAPRLSIFEGAKVVGSYEQGISVVEALTLLRPTRESLCYKTSFHVFSIGFTLSVADSFFSIVLDDRVLLFCHNQGSFVCRLVGENLKQLVTENHEEQIPFCIQALLSLVSCQSEDIKTQFEELQNSLLQEIQQVKCVSDFFKYKDVVSSREKLQQLQSSVQVFQQVLQDMISTQALESSGEKNTSFLVPESRLAEYMIARLYSILRVMDHLVARIDLLIETSKKTEHWLLMESDAAQSQILSFDVPLTFSAACFLLCFLFFGFTGMNVGIPIYHSHYRIDYWFGMIVIIIVFLLCYSVIMTRWLVRLGPKLSCGQVPTFQVEETILLPNSIDSRRISFLSTLGNFE
eukprot:jgi/Galph1/6057/GphlegSOOS_G4656.1